jgi:hypothetical protein
MLCRQGFIDSGNDHFVRVVVEHVRELGAGHALLLEARDGGAQIRDGQHRRAGRGERRAQLVARPRGEGGRRTAGHHWLMKQRRADMS